MMENQRRTTGNLQIENTLSSKKIESYNFCHEKAIFNSCSNNDHDSKDHSVNLRKVLKSRQWRELFDYCRYLYNYYDKKTTYLDKQRMGKVLHYLANANVARHKYDNANLYFKRSLEHLECINDNSFREYNSVTDNDRERSKRCLRDVLIDYGKYVTKHGGFNNDARLAKAKDVFEKVFELEPTARAYYFYGTFLAQRKMYKDAEKYLKLSIELNNQHNRPMSAYYYFYAFCLKQLNKIDLFETNFDIAQKYYQNQTGKSTEHTRPPFLYTWVSQTEKTIYWQRQAKSKMNKKLSTSPNKHRKSKKHRQHRNSTTYSHYSNQSFATHSNYHLVNGDETNYNEYGGDPNGTLTRFSSNTRFDSVIDNITGDYSMVDRNRENNANQINSQHHMHKILSGHNNCGSDHSPIKFETRCIADRDSNINYYNYNNNNNNNITNDINVQESNQDIRINSRMNAASTLEFDWNPDVAVFVPNNCDQGKQLQENLNNIDRIKNDNPERSLPAGLPTQSNSSQTQNHPSQGPNVNINNCSNSTNTLASYGNDINKENNYGIIDANNINYVDLENNDGFFDTISLSQIPQSIQNIEMPPTPPLPSQLNPELDTSNVKTVTTYTVDKNSWDQECPIYAIDGMCECKEGFHRYTLQQAMNLQTPFDQVPLAISFFHSVRSRFLDIFDREYETRMDQLCQAKENLNYYGNIATLELLSKSHKSICKERSQILWDKIYNRISQDYPNPSKLLTYSLKQSIIDQTDKDIFNVECVHALLDMLIVYIYICYLYI